MAALSSELHQASFSPEGSRLITERGNSAVDLIDAKTGKTIASFGNENDRRALASASGVSDAGPVTWSPDGRFFGLRSLPPGGPVWDGSLQVTGRIRFPSSVEIRDAERANVVTTIASRGREIDIIGFTSRSDHIWLLDGHDLRLSRLRDPRLIAVAKCAEVVEDLSVRNDGQLIAAVEGSHIGRRRIIRLVRTINGMETCTILVDQDAWRLAFRESTQELIVTHGNGSVSLFNSETGAEVRCFQDHNKGVLINILAVARGGEVIATATSEDAVGPVIVSSPGCK